MVDIFKDADGGLVDSGVGGLGTKYNYSQYREIDWESIRYMNIEKKLDIILRILDAMNFVITIDEAKALGLDKYLKEE